MGFTAQAPSYRRLPTAARASRPPPRHDAPILYMPPHKSEETRWVMHRRIRSAWCVSQGGRGAGGTSQATSWRGSWSPGRPAMEHTPLGLSDAVNFHPARRRPGEFTATPIMDMSQSLYAG